MLFGAPELLAHVGNLPLNMPQSFELRGLLDRRLEARRDLLHAGIQRFDRCCRHSLTDRTLEPLCHLDQPPVEIRWFLGHRGKPKRRRGVAWYALRLRGTEGRLGFRCWGARRRSRRREPIWLGHGKTRRHRANLREGLVERRLAFDLGRWLRR